jgi:hypothetical protein
MTDKLKNLNLTQSAYDFADVLKLEGAFNEIGEAFRFGLAYALKINPNIKENIGSKEYTKNIADMASIDRENIFSWTTEHLSNQVEFDDVNKRIRFLGCWGLNQIESRYWDNDLKTLDWEKLDKDTQ